MATYDSYLVNGVSLKKVFEAMDSGAQVVNTSRIELYKVLNGSVFSYEPRIYFYDNHFGDACKGVFNVVSNYKINNVDLGSSYYPVNTRYYTSGTNQTIPSEATYMHIISIGGGGGGGGGGDGTNSSFSGDGGGGGSSGTVGVNCFIPITTRTFDVIVGTGGDGGSYGTDRNGYVGTSGTNSYIKYDGKYYSIGYGGLPGEGGWNNTYLDNSSTATQSVINCKVNTTSYDIDGKTGENGSRIPPTSSNKHGLGGSGGTNPMIGPLFLESDVQFELNSFNYGYGGNGGNGDAYGDNNNNRTGGADGNNGIVIVFFYFTPIPSSYTIINVSPCLLHYTFEPNPANSNIVIDNFGNYNGNMTSNWLTTTKFKYGSQSFQGLQYNYNVVNIPQMQIIPENGLTIACWIQFTENSYNTIWELSFTNGRIGLYCDNTTGKYKFYGNTQNNFNPTFTFSTINTWFHIVCTISPTKICLIYLNGSFIAGITAEGTFIYPTDGRIIGIIGTGITYSDRLTDIYIDDFRIYNTVLTQTQITALYTSQSFII